MIALETNVKRAYKQQQQQYQHNSYNKNKYIKQPNLNTNPEYNSKLIFSQIKPKTNRRCKTIHLEKYNTLN